MFFRRPSRLIAIGATVIAIGGSTYGILSAAAGNSSGTATTAASPAAASGAPMLGGGGSNARSGPAAGGTVGTITSVSKSSFTISTSAGQKVTVNKASSTTYRQGTRPASATAVKKGETVLALGTVNGKTVTASQVVVQPTGSGTSTGKVVPFQRGAPSQSKQVGQIPANYTEGSGTIVSGTKANKATSVALAAYPGGIVDRVVELSNGEYEVHNIGVKWPHHIFVNQSFRVVGAD